MRDELKDIRQKISDGIYKNEEHVRLSLVSRILIELGWNVWDPEEVNSEYKAVPYEDVGRVDIALFLTARRPSVFIEVKSVGKIQGSLHETELQLRNYNRDNTALFSIITDGRIWRFYLSQTGGKFSEKCFKIVDVLDDELDEVESSLNTFLKKSQIEIGEAEREAKKYLTLNEMERLMQELLPQARKLIEKPPFPSLPEALVGLVNEEGDTISAEQAKAFIKKASKNSAKLKPKSEPPAPTVHVKSAEQEFSPGQPPDLHFTKIIQATLGSQSVNKWNALVRCAVKLALKNNVSISHLKNLGVRVEEGYKTNEGFRPLTNMNASVQGVDAGHAWHLALFLAKELNIEIKVRFRWREKDGAAHPGEQGLLHWKPQS